MFIIVHMNLAAVDLNLLVAFEALMEERNVTRAGQRVGLAQPSMSSALTRLRALFADDLFVRSGSGMQPTAKAVSLARPISEALGQIRGVFEPGSAFEPAIARRRFSIAVTDYGVYFGYYGMVLGLGVLAVVVVAITRGDLSYRRYRREVGDAPV